MTIRKRIKTELENCGLFEEEAEQIVADLRMRDSQQAMANRWDDADTSITPEALTVTWIAARSEALKWIDANNPSHWARPMFVD